MVTFLLIFNWLVKRGMLHWYSADNCKKIFHFACLLEENELAKLSNLNFNSF